MSVMPKQVALIGGDASYSQAPFDDPTWEIWGCNSLWNLCRNAKGTLCASRWFEMHPMSVQTNQELAAIQQCPIPLYHLGDATVEQAPCGVPYPLDSVLSQFPYKYFTCTFAYQIALALHEGFTTIGLFGIELEKGTTRERFVEKACVEFWMGLALGMGTKLIIPDDSCLTGQEYLYGYEYHQEVASVDSEVDGLFFRRVMELEKKGLAERISLPTLHREGTA